VIGFCIKVRGAKMNRVILAAFGVLLATAAGQSEEYFGVFSDGPSGTFIRAEPRPLFRLSHVFRFKDPNGFEWSVPQDAEVDGASIPTVFWSVIGGPFEGNYLKASVIHDHYCRAMERTAHDTHRNFYYGMRAEGVPDWKAKLMHWAVATFGPSWKIEKRVVQEMTCSSDNNRCTITPVERQEVVSEPSVDLEDPEVLAVALAKFGAIAKTLKTTNGETLDVTAFGNVDASLKSIEENAAEIRRSVETKEFRTNPDALGILVPAEIRSIDDIQAWPQNSLPTYSAVPGLNDETQVPANGVFRLEPGGATDLQRDLRLEERTFQLPRELRQLPQ
jgi:hypothetical protein